MPRETRGDASADLARRLRDARVAGMLTEAHEAELNAMENGTIPIAEPSSRLAKRAEAFGKLGVFSGNTVQLPFVGPEYRFCVSACHRCSAKPVLMSGTREKCGSGGKQYGNVAARSPLHRCFASSPSASYYFALDHRTYAKAFVAVSSLDEAYRLSLDCMRAGAPCLYEVITDHVPVKLFFDLDRDTKNNDIKPYSLAERQQDLSDALVAFAASETCRTAPAILASSFSASDAFVFCADRPGKESLHVIHPGVVFAEMRSLRNFKLALRAFLQGAECWALLESTIDWSVYTRNRLFRCWGHCKLKDLGMLELARLRLYSPPGLVMSSTTWSASLVTCVAGAHATPVVCEMLCTLASPLESRARLPGHTLGSALVDLPQSFDVGLVLQAVNAVVLGDWAFKSAEVKRRLAGDFVRIWCRRGCAAFCKFCNREHEHDNSLALEVNLRTGITTYHCARQFIWCQRCVRKFLLVLPSAQRNHLREAAGTESPGVTPSVRRIL